ncbi:MAG: anthranilate phosphoribosyltransferase [Clostridiales bacterium]|nr:anthranilate phosphoribosyltransferase [Clostridiales bacterium]
MREEMMREESCIRKAIKKLTSGIDLHEDEVIAAISEIMDGFASDAQTAAFITALKLKGENAAEIAGCVRIMREKAEKLKITAPFTIDTCGTGGDGTNTFNISTASAIVAAAAGATVAKHGNRSVSSRCGSADVLEALGVNINLPPLLTGHCIDEVGIGFLFAPLYHKSMKHAATARKEIGISTIFNIAGPLSNPAEPGGQVVGVNSARLMVLVPEALCHLNIKRAMVLYASDGMDEITLSGETSIVEIKDGRIVGEYSISPGSAGLSEAPLSALAGGSAIENAKIIQNIFDGEKGPAKDVVVINCAAALYVAALAGDMKEGADIAKDAISSGKAKQKFKQFAAFTNKYSS